MAEISNQVLPHFDLQYGRVCNKSIKLAFDDPEVSSNGGTLLLRQELERSQLLSKLASSISDRRHSSYTKHQVSDLLIQRVLQICLGDADCIDCDTLKSDPMLKLGTGRDPKDNDLASQSTMSRLENSVTIRDLIRLGYALCDHFLDSFEGRSPKIICIDMDPTAHRVYGQQELALFNWKVDDYCFMPFHVYDGITGRLITAVMRPGKTPSGEEIITIIKRIISRIRKRFPSVRLVFRADSHHCCPDVLDYLDENTVDYVLAISQNSALNERCKPIREEVRKGCQRTLKEYRRFHSFDYAARSWSRHRRVICRAIGNDRGTDLRYIVTSFDQAGAKYLYETVYCARGRAELFIKEHKIDLLSDRSSCTSKLANQFRLFVHSAAYALMHSFRERHLAGTALARATFATIRVKLLKVGVRLACGKTFIRIHAPEAFRFKDIYSKVAGSAVQLQPG